jgi:DNA-binding transcriptional LysR family regulator
MAREWADRAGEMEVLVRVVEHGSFSAAGRELGLTPSAVSRIVARMEARLGVRLLIRTTRALTLTPEGEAYHRAALRILEDMAETERAVTDQAAPRGRLRVTASLSYGRLFIAPVLAGFLERYPGILLDLSLSDTIVDLTGGQADVAIRVGDLADSGLKARKLGDSGRVVVASPDYLARRGTPRTPEELLTHNCIGFNWRRTRLGWPFRRDGRDFELAVSGNVEANSGDTVVQMARDGLGVARVGAFVVAEDLAAGRLIALLEAYNPGEREVFHAVFLGGAQVPARVRVFVDYLAEHVGGRSGQASSPRGDG